MRKIFWLISIFVIGGIGGIFFDRIGIPYLAATRLGERFPVLRRASERTTIVNKTEVVRVEESEAIPDLAERVKNAVVPVEVVKRVTGKGKSATLVKEIVTGFALTNDGFILLHADAANTVTSSVRLADSDGRALEFIVSDTSSNFMLLRTGENRFAVLPFEDDTPRLGSRLFTLSAHQIGKTVTPDFQANILSAVAPDAFQLSSTVAADAIIVNFEGRVVGMSVEDAEGQSTIIPAARLRDISDGLLQKQK